MMLAAPASRAGHGRRFGLVTNFRRAGATAFALALAMIAGTPGIALADVVTNSVVASASGVASINPGESINVKYWIDAQAGDGGATGTGNCNAADGTPATVDITVPSGVTATGLTAGKLTFTECGSATQKNQTVTFTAAVAGNYAINVSAITDSGSGTYTRNGDFTLRVEGPPTVVTDAGDSSRTEGLAQTVSGKFADPNGANTLTTISKRSTDAGTLTTNTDGSWSWTHTPTAVGTGSVRITATDDKGATVNDDFTWTATANQAPTVATAAADSSRVEGLEQTASGSFADADGVSTLTISKRAGDAGTVTANAGGTWSWKHTPTAVGSGTVQVTATDHKGATVTDEFTWTATPARASTGISAVSGSGSYGGPATLTATLKAGTTELSGKTIEFKLGTSVVGTATTNASGVATLSNVNHGRDAGTYADFVTATFAGDSTHFGSNGTSSLTVNKANQATLTVTAPGSGTYGDELTIVTSGGSGTGAETYDAGTSTACEIVSGKLKITSGTGTCSVTATKAADGNYNGTTSAAKTVTVGKAAQATLSVVVVSTGEYNTRLSLGTTGGSGSGGVSYAVTLDTTACLIGSGADFGKLVITSGSGICKVIATKQEDTNFSSATSAAAEIAVTKASATLSLSGLSKTYNGSPQGVSVTTTPGDLSGVTVTYDGSATVPTNAGSYTVRASLFNSNYAGSDAVGTLVIAPKALTGSFTASSKVYDGSRVASVSPAALSGVLGNDVVELVVTSALFDTKNVGTGKDVVGALSLSGAQAGNYSVNSSHTTKADITALGLTGSFTASSKVYDGGVGATVASRSLPGLLGNDVVTLAVTNAAFDTKNVGTNKDVVGSLSLGGADAGNYSVNSSHTAKADITALGLTVTGITASDKAYDGNTTATLDTSRAALAGVVSGDVVTLNVSGATGSFASANVGTHAVTISGLSLDGTDKGNYTLGTVTTTATIGAWTLQGFHSPIGVANTIYTAPGTAAPAATSTTLWQTAKGGSTIPLKFNVFAGNTEKTATSDVKSFNATKLAGCTSSANDLVEELANAGSSSLRYDSIDKQFIQNWKTSTVSGDTCYRVTLTMLDNGAIHTFVKLRK